MARLMELARRHKSMVALFGIAVLCIAVAGAMSTRFALARAASADTLGVPGTVQTVREDVVSRAQGRVVGLPVVAGDHVVAGQPLAILSNPSVTAQANLARARLAAALAPFQSYSLIAPAGGTVLKVYRSSGSLVTAGNPILALGNPGSLRASVSTADIQGLPLVGQTAWVRSGASAPVAATVDAVDKDRVTALLPGESGFRLDDPVEVRFDVGQPGDPVVTYRGTITANYLIIRAIEDGQVTDVASEGDVIAPGSIVARVGRMTIPTAAESLAISEAKESARLAEEQESALTVVAPSTGTVSSLGASLGQSVTPGSPIAQIIGDNQMRVKLSVDANQQSLWAVGAVVHISGIGAAAIDGVVAAAQPTGSGLEMSVGLPSCGGLSENQLVMVTPTLSPGTVLVPAKSVGGTGDSRWIRTLTAFSGVRRRPVILIAVSGQYAVISGIGARSLVALAP